MRTRGNLHRKIPEQDASLRFLDRAFAMFEQKRVYTTKRFAIDLVFSW